jgi:hypothetical protein
MDEEQVLEALENASDYEHGFSRLDGEQKDVVRKLQDAAGDAQISRVVMPQRAYPLLLMLDALLVLKR